MSCHNCTCWHPTALGRGWCDLHEIETQWDYSCAHFSMKKHDVVIR